MRCQLAALQNQLFDLAGEHVHTPDDHHVVAAASDLFHAAHARACSARQQSREIACPVADDRQGFLGQAGKDQLAHFAIGDRFTRFGVDDLGVEMVFPDGRAVLGFDALTGHTRAHHLGQAVNVHGVNGHALLDRTSHVIRPGFRTKDANAQRAAGGIDPLTLKLVGDRQHVAGGDHDDVRLEILDQLHLALGLAAAKGHHRQTQFFSAVVCAQSAGEQAVAIAHMHQITGLGTPGADAARHHGGPGVNVAGGITHDRRLACGAARGVNAGAVLARHGKHAKRVALAQVGFGREREPGDVSQALAVLRVYTCRVELGAVHRRIGIGVMQGLLQTLELQRAHLVDAGFLDGFERKRFGGHQKLQLNQLGTELKICPAKSLILEKQYLGSGRSCHGTWPRPHHPDW